MCPQHNIKKKEETNWLAMVAQACNLSYLGGRDQEQSSSRTVWKNSL
jgi:hypothetical protein